MKETVNVNIGSQAFTLDQDARAALENYLSDIRSRLPENDTETINDIELRIAEIFCERTSSPMLVITIDMVQAAMQQMGTPSDFGERRDASAAKASTATADPRKLYRSRKDRLLAGICGGLAEFFDADPTLLRLITLLLIFLGGLSFWLYIILWIVVPEQPAPLFNITDKKR